MEAMDFEDKVMILFAIAGIILTAAGIYLVYRLFKKSQQEELAVSIREKNTESKI